MWPIIYIKMKINIIYSDQIKLSPALKLKINKTIRNTYSKAEKLIELKPLTFFVYGNPGIDVKRVGGYTPSGSVIQIALNPKSRITGAYLDLLSMTVAHELHHAARWNGIGFGDTLFDVLISEGMGKLFEGEVTGLELDPLIAKFGTDEMRGWYAKAKKEFLSEKYSYADWFFGSEARAIPKRMGYALGCYIVSEYMRLKNLKPSQLVNVKSDKIYATIIKAL